MNIGEAIEHMKRGGTVHRAGWNDKGMFLLLIRGNYAAEGAATEAGREWAIDVEALSARPSPIDLRELPLRDWIGMKTADDTLVPWLASQTDLLAEDWEARDAVVRTARTTDPIAPGDVVSVRDVNSPPMTVERLVRDSGEMLAETVWFEGETAKRGRFRLCKLMPCAAAAEPKAPSA